MYLFKNHRKTCNQYKKELEELKAINRDLLKTKNEQEKENAVLRTRFEDCPHCQRKSSYPD